LITYSSGPCRLYLPYPIPFVKEKSYNLNGSKITQRTRVTRLDASLVKITKGTGIAFTGSLAALFLAFIARLIIARYGTEADYGVFSLAFVILNICAVIAALGLQEGVTRSIAYARGQNDNQRIQKLIPASIQFALIAGIALGIIVFFTSDIIASGVFHDAALAVPLKIFAFAIPFFTLIYVFVSVFRGFDDVKPAVYFRDILRNLLLLLFLLPVILLHLPFNHVFYAHLAAMVISCVALILYAPKRLPVPVGLRTALSANPVAGQLLSFSLPLLGIAVLHLIIAWTDTLMLGAMRSSVDVALYNAAHPLAQFISSPLVAMLSIYMPVASGLYAQGSMAEMRRNFSVLTKWLCSATLPLFFIIFLFPETVLAFLFGTSYAPAATALKILSVGYIVNNFLGPNGATLIAMGQVRFIMWVTLASAVLNVGLNLALIPPFGIEGAAIASVAAITSINVLSYRKLYTLSGAQPLSRKLLKPTLVSLALVFLFKFILEDFVAVVWWMLPLLFILYYVVYGLAILFTRSFDKEDITMLLAMEKRAGLNLSSIKKILRRFL
jgi:O-antigen/teichoic acid export membrane protein